MVNLSSHSAFWDTRSTKAIYLQLFTFGHWQHPIWLMIPQSAAEWLLAVTVVYSYTLK